VEILRKFQKPLLVKNKSIEMHNFFSKRSKRERSFYWKTSVEPQKYARLGECQ
jgi:hypothetical protein